MEWLGEVPGHWDVTQLKRVVNPDRQITYGIVQAGPHVQDGIPYIRPADMTDEHGVLAPDGIMRTSQDIASSYSRSTILTGDLVCSIGPSYGKVMVTPAWLNGANLTQGTARIAVHKPHDTRYLFWTLRSQLSFAQWESSVGGATFRALNLGPLAETTIPVPSETEQTHIAAFLDRETAKIDGLVAEQRRLMELLKEKRQAVISHAVTKGLNPDAPMKPSGIEWLGDVPAHWEVKKVRHFAEVLRGKFTHRPRNDPAFYDGEFPFVQTGDITGSSRYITGFKQTLNERGIAVSKEFPKGTLIMAIAANIGDVAILDFPAYFPDSIVGLVPKMGVDLMFLYYLMIGMKQPMLMTATVSTQMNLNVDQICSLTAACPPLDEQARIVSHLDEVLQMMDTLTAEAQRAIELLQERRTALISAAVTGQIDVRQQTRN